MSVSSAEDLDNSPMRTGAAVEGYAFDPQYTPQEMKELESQRREDPEEELERKCSCENCPEVPISAKCCRENWPPTIRPVGCLAKTEEFKTLISRTHLYVLYYEVNAGRNPQDLERDPENK